MMREIKGNLLTCGADIICQQVNCQGVMGAGLARQIAPYLSARQMDAYKEQCNIYNSRDLLGRVIYFQTSIGIIANCLAQDHYGRSGLYTDYYALRKCLEDVYNFAWSRKQEDWYQYGIDHDITVGIPKYIGCGLAGGDWNIVDEIIHDIFDHPIHDDVPCMLVEYKKG